MIIFDLDGTLADCEHRRHFVDQKKNHEKYTKEYEEKYDKFYPGPVGKSYFWQPDWQAFYEACDKDVPIIQTIEVLWSLQKSYCTQDIRIWSARDESVRQKTMDWIDQYIDPAKYWNWNNRLKMRPVGDSTPDYMLKEMWLNELCEDRFSFQKEGKKFPEKHNIDFVFDSDPRSIEMYRKRGIFVFNCAQHEGKF